MESASLILTSLAPASIGELFGSRVMILKRLCAYSAGNLCWLREWIEPSPTAVQLVQTALREAVMLYELPRVGGKGER